MLPLFSPRTLGALLGAALLLTLTLVWVLVRRAR